MSGLRLQAISFQMPSAPQTRPIVHPSDKKKYFTNVSKLAWLELGVCQKSAPVARSRGGQGTKIAGGMFPIKQRKEVLATIKDVQARTRPARARPARPPRWPRCRWWPLPSVSRASAQLRTFWAEAQLRTFWAEAQLRTFWAEAQLRTFCAEAQLRTFWAEAQLRTFCAEAQLRTFCAEAQLRTFCAEAQLRTFSRQSL